MDYHGRERRRRNRVKVHLPLTIKFPQGDITTYATNVSMLGAYAESDKKLKPSAEKREFILELTSSRKIRCSGVILGCEPKVNIDSEKTYYHLNIFFSHFFDDDEEKLDVYIEDVLAQQKKVLDRWIKERKAKSEEKIAREKALKAKKEERRAKEKALRAKNKKQKAKEKAQKAKEKALKAKKKGKRAKE